MPKKCSVIVIIKTPYRNLMTDEPVCTTFSQKKKYEFRACINLISHSPNSFREFNKFWFAIIGRCGTKSERYRCGVMAMLLILILTINPMLFINWPYICASEFEHHSHINSKRHGKAGRFHESAWHLPAKYLGFYYIPESLLII